MKALIGAGVIATMALWIGYSVGLHKGIREEQLAWEATATINPDSEGNRREIVNIDNTTVHKGILVLYKNPHFGPIVMVARGLRYQGISAENRPDPKVYRQYDGISP